MPSHPNPAPAKCESKSGHVGGLRNRRTIAPLRSTTPKPASGNERAIKKGGGGLPPATLCVRAFSRESLDPRPGPGGNPRGRGHPASVSAGLPTNDGGPRPPAGYAVPRRAPARDRAGTHVAGPTLRRSQRDHLPITKAPRPSQGAQFMGQCPASPASAPGRQPPPGPRLRPEGCGRPPPGWRRW